MNLIKNRDLFDIKVCQTPEIAAYELAEEILESSHEVIQAKGRCVWAVSGGSSILKFYDALGKLIDPMSDIWHHITICWVDERHVPHEHKESNFGNACRNFWNNIEGPNLIPVPYNDDSEISANQYRKQLSKHGIGQNKNIDLLILGMGVDGHTASLFPDNNSAREWDSGQNVLTAEFDGMKRVTLNYPILNRSEKIRFLAYGSEKGETFGKAFRAGDWSKYPFLKISRSQSLFYVDNAFYQNIDATIQNIDATEN